MGVLVSLSLKPRSNIVKIKEKTDQIPHCGTLSSLLVLKCFNDVVKNFEYGRLPPIFG